MKTVVTIGRQFGSGGRAIGKKLAAELGIPFYDKELIALAAKESGLNEEILSTVDEIPSSGFMYNLFSNAGRIMAPVEVPLNDKLFITLTNTIKGLANESCVIVGRCGNYILKDDPDVTSVFIYADMSDRIEKIMAQENVSEEKAMDLIKKIDKVRASYANYYTDKKWGSLESYNYMLNSSVLGYDNTVEIIKRIVSLREHNE